MTIKRRFKPWFDVKVIFKTNFYAQAAAIGRPSYFFAVRFSSQNNFKKFIARAVVPCVNIKNLFKILKNVSVFYFNTGPRLK